MPADPRDAALVEVAANVVARLVVAHRLGDCQQITAEVLRLLDAVAKYSAALAERPSDAPLRRAVAALSAQT